MAVPKKKTSKSKRNMRRAHDAIKQINVVYNKTTGEPQLPHHVSVDGYYNDKQVIVEKEKTEENQEEQPQEKAQKTSKKDS